MKITDSPKPEDFKYQTFSVERVKNGFVLRFDENLNVGRIANEVYVFNDSKQLSEFISQFN